MNSVPHSKFVPLVLLSLLILGMVGCGGGGLPSLTSNPTPTTPSSAPLSVSPSAPILFPAERIRFSAGGPTASAARGQHSATNTVSAPSVTWSVNGVVGGTPATGTITSDGTYTAPPIAVAVTVKAVSQSDSNTSGTASVQVSATAVEGVRPTIFRIAVPPRGEVFFDPPLQGPPPIMYRITSESLLLPSGEVPITIYGAHFDPGASVWIGGQQRTAIVVSSGEIQTTTPNLTEPGEVPVFVVNPGEPQRIGARNLHVGIPYDQSIGGFCSASRVIADEVRGRIVLLTYCVNTVDGAWLELVAVDLQARTVSLRVPVSGSWGDLDPDTGKLYVLHAGPNPVPDAVGGPTCIVDKYDSTDGTLLSSTDLGGSGCDDLRVHPMLHQAYIPAGDRVRVFDLKSDQEIASLGPFAPGIKLSLEPGSTTAAFAYNLFQTQVALVDLNSGAVLDDFPLEDSAWPLVLDQAHGRLFMVTALAGTSVLRSYDLASKQVVAISSFAGSDFGGLVLSPDKANLLMLGEAGDVWVFDAASLTARARIPTSGGLLVTVGDTVAVADYTVTAFNLSTVLTARQLGAITAQRAGDDQIELSFHGANLQDLPPVLYFDGAAVPATPVPDQLSWFRATVPLSWAESTQLHSVWMGDLQSTATNVLGFGFSSVPFGGDAHNATFCLGADGMAILADRSTWGDSSVARWLDLRQGAELIRTAPGANGCTFDETGTMALLVNSNGLEIYDAKTATVQATANVPASWYSSVVVDSATGLAYAGDKVVDTATGQIVQTLPKFPGWSGNTGFQVGVEGFLGIDPAARRLVSYFYFVNLDDLSMTETAIDTAIAGPDRGAAPWGKFGVDHVSHLAIMPWRYGVVALIDMQSGAVTTNLTGGELYFGACAGDGMGFVLDRATPSVIAVDLLTGGTIAKFASPALPSECAYDRDVHTLWILSSLHGELFSIDVGKALAPAPPPPAPQ